MRITETASGDSYDISVDFDGDVQLSNYSQNMWFRPADLVAALRAAGVDLSEPETPAESTPEPSDRVRVSWRASAADDTERARFARLAAARAVRNREAEIRQAAHARRAGRFFRDRDGDVWRQNAQGRMRLVWLASSFQRPDAFRDVSEDMVRVHFGPLTECPNPFYGEYRQRWVTGMPAPERKFRDRRGREWVTGPDPERIHPIHVNGARGAGFRRTVVERLFGPLRPADVNIAQALRTAMDHTGMDF